VIVRRLVSERPANCQSLVVLVLDDGGALLRNARAHELAHDAAEIGRHQDRLEAGHVVLVHPLVDHADETDELVHGRANVRRGDTVGNAGLGVEVRQVNRRRVAGGSFDLGVEREGHG
jgi:hypothetical protein